MAKLCVLVMMICAVAVAFALSSIGKAWLFVWAMGAGIGPVLILRWFWWRVNAWSEIAALASSVLLAVGFEVTAAIQAGADYRLFATPVMIGDVALQTHHKAMILVPVTIVVWLAVTLATRPVREDRLRSFYRLVRPGGWWGQVARLEPDVVCDGLNTGIVRLWLAGCAGVFGTLFGIGYLVLGRPGPGLLLLGAAAVSGTVLGRALARD